MAKGSSFGGTVKLNGEDEYKKALRDITSNLKLVSSELKLTNTEFSNGDKNIKQAKTSYDSMKNTLQSQKDKVKELKEALSKMEKEYGSNNETVRIFKTQLNNAENQLKQMEDATDKSNKELKEMKKGFDDAGDGALKFSDVLKANVLGDVIVDGLKKIGSATLEIGKAFVEVGKQAIDNYADYEQLIGGVETLFKDSASIVEGYANNAYKTAGLSANDYMETVTSFSASLLQSLNNDTAKSAEVADMAITDIHTYLKALLEPCSYVVFYNLLLCLPFGVYLHYYFQKSFGKTLFYTFLLSLFFELTQLSGLYFIYPRGYRLFDVDDLILNTLGGVIGYFVATIFMRVLPSRRKIDDKAYLLGQKISFLKRGIVVL